jgi:hypothetical protein
MSIKRTRAVDGGVTGAVEGTRLQRKTARAARFALVALAVGGARTPSASALEKPVANPTERTSELRHHGSIFADPLGFAIFGPRIGIEGGGSRVAAAVYGRWFNAGLLSHSLFINSGDDFDFSYGVGVRGRYYAADDMSGWLGGIGVEYIWARAETPSAQILTKSAYVVPQIEVGYRVPLGAWYAGASGGVGYAFKTSGSIEDLPGGTNASLYQVLDKSSVYGTVNVELGVYF